MGIFVYSTLGQRNSSVAKSLLIISETLVQRAYLPQILDFFFFPGGLAKNESFNFLFRLRHLLATVVMELSASY